VAYELKSAVMSDSIANENEKKILHTVKFIDLHFILFLLAQFDRYASNFTRALLYRQV
jgi:hypothetical protein